MKCCQMKALLVAGLFACLASLGAARQASAYDVKEIGSYYIGGRMVSVTGLPHEQVRFYPGAPPIDYDPNGTVRTGQMYVHFVRLENPTGRLPIIMIHGGGLSGVGWESTPDGRPGWQQYFLSAGYDVLVPDGVERGRSNWSRWPQIYTSAPLFRTAQEGWTLFRLGTHYDLDQEKRVSWPGVQFPLAAYDTFVASFAPRWTTNDDATQAAYDALIDRECPCILIVHSQGGSFGVRAALHAPDKVRALVGLEPTGAPDPATVDVAKLKAIPMLFVWGDNLGKYEAWKRILVNPAKFALALRSAGGHVDWVNLPERGIYDNSHMMMIDRNSDQVAGVVRDWLKEQGQER